MQLETGNNINNYQLSIHLILRELGGIFISKKYVSASAYKLYKNLVAGTTQ